MKSLDTPVRTSYVNPIKDWYDQNYIPTTTDSAVGKYEKGMLISISNNQLYYESIFKSFKELYISLVVALTGKYDENGNCIAKGKNISKWDVKVLKGDWKGDRVNLPKREELLRVIADETPIMLGGVHNYKKDDIRSRGREYSHSHFYIYNTHHYLPTTPKELRDVEDRIEKHLARYVNTRKMVQGTIRITPVGTGIYRYTDNVSPLELYDYLRSPLNNPQHNNVINYIANNRHLPSIQYPLTTIYSTKKI